MIRRRSLFFLSIAFLVATISASTEAATITDMAGREVMIPANVERIVCLGPGTLRLIVYLQAESSVVGVEDLEKRFPGGRPYWLAHPELTALPSCGPGGVASINQRPDLETVLKLSPDVIFITYMDATLADEVQALLTIPVVVLSYGDFSTFDETVYTALRLAGSIVGRSERAEAVVRSIEAWRQDLSRRTADVAGERPSVYVGGIGFRNVQGIESTQHHYPPLDWLNTENLARRVKPKSGSHLSVGKEMLLKLDPSAVFIDGGGTTLVSADIKKHPGFYRSLTAFDKGRFYTLHPFNWYVTNIDTALTNAYAMGKILYPDAFEEIDPEQTADEIYRELVGRPVYEKMKADYGPIGQTVPIPD